MCDHSFKYEKNERCWVHLRYSQDSLMFELFLMSQRHQRNHLGKFD